MFCHYTLNCIIYSVSYTVSTELYTDPVYQTCHFNFISFWSNDVPGYKKELAPQYFWKYGSFDCWITNGIKGIEVPSFSSIAGFSLIWIFRWHFGDFLEIKFNGNTLWSDLGPTRRLSQNIERWKCTRNCTNRGTISFY